MASRTHGGDGAGSVPGACCGVSTSGLGGAGGGGGGAVDDDGAALVGAGGVCVVVGAGGSVVVGRGSVVVGCGAVVVGRGTVGRGGPAVVGGGRIAPGGSATASCGAVVDVGGTTASDGAAATKQAATTPTATAGMTSTRRRFVAGSRVTFDMCDLQRQPLRASSGTPRRRPLQRASRRSTRAGGELPASTEPGPVTVWSQRRGRLDLPSHKAPAPVAQWIEHLTTDQKVGSSTLSGRAKNVLVRPVPSGSGHGGPSFKDQRRDRQRREASRLVPPTRRIAPRASTRPAVQRIGLQTPSSRAVDGRSHGRSSAKAR